MVVKTVNNDLDDIKQTNEHEAPPFGLWHIDGELGSKFRVYTQYLISKHEGNQWEWFSNIEAGGKSKLI